MRMGFEHWEVEYQKHMGWEIGLVPRTLPSPPFRTLSKRDL